MTSERERSTEHDGRLLPDTSLRGDRWLRCRYPYDRLRFLAPVQPDRTVGSSRHMVLSSAAFAAVTECGVASRNGSARWPRDSQPITTLLPSDQCVSRPMHRCWLCPRRSCRPSPSRGGARGEPDTAWIIADGLPATCCAALAAKRLRCLVRKGNCGTILIRARIFAASTTVDSCFVAPGTRWRLWPTARLIRPAHLRSLREPAWPKETQTSLCVRFCRTLVRHGNAMARSHLPVRTDRYSTAKMLPKSQNGKTNAEASPQLHCLLRSRHQPMRSSHFPSLGGRIDDQQRPT